MHNLGTVIKFETLRALKKPTFWLAIFAIPIVYAVIFFVGHITSQQTNEKLKELSEGKFSFQITDESGVVDNNIVGQFEGKISANKEESIKEVKEGSLDAYYYIPKNLQEDKIELYGKDRGFSETDKYRIVLDAILKNSGNTVVEPNKIAIVNKTYKTDQTIFKNGEKYDRVSEMIVPGAFLVIFYFVVSLLSGRMLTSTTEEKENRVTEMILTSISAKTLIVGKIISLFILGVVQIFTLFTPIILGYFAVINGKLSGVNLPDIRPFIENIKLNPTSIAIAVTVLVAGFLMITSFIVALGSAMPTAQEAGNWVSFIILALMAPFFMMNMFLVGSNNLAVHVISYFPLTSPIALLLRNTLGTLAIHEAIIGIGLLVMFTAIAIALAVRIFQYGTISYGKKVSLKTLFSNK